MDSPSSVDAFEAALVLDGVSKRFQVGERVVQALDQVGVRVRRGIVTGLIGPDGAGKTTLMRLAVGLLMPDAGAISLLGLEVGKHAQRVQSLVGYMPQRFGLYEDLTVQENLDLYADLRAVAIADRQQRYAELMRMTGLAPFNRRLAGRLSGGMKQKLGLACALVGAPAMLLLDEPTVGVDPISRHELWAILHRLVNESATTVVLSTAYLDEAERCAEVILMHEGRVLAHDVPAALTRPLAGHSFYLSSSEISKRQLQERASRMEGVIDAIVQGSRVRIVTQTTSAPAVNQLCRPGEQIEVSPTAARFEDSFVSMLRALPVEDGREPPARWPSQPPTRVEQTPPAPASVVRSSAGDEMIVVRNLSRCFGSFYAVREVSFSVRRGEVFGLLGANGAGKSTTFRMLCGLLPASEGTLRVAGVDLRHAAAQARARIGYVAQKFSLYADLSVAQNLRFFSRAYGLSGARQRRRLQWALDEFQLAPYADVNARDLPLGFKQRLALAAALTHEPDILFLDEATSGVDPLGRREFWRRINALAESGITIMVTTHFMEEAEYCDRLVIMAQGRVLAEGSSEALRAGLRSPRMPDPTMEDAFVALINSQSAAA